MIRCKETSSKHVLSANVSRSVKEDVTRVAQISCAECHSQHSSSTANNNKYTNVNLHRPFLSARYLSGLCFSGEHEQQLNRMIERSVTRRSDDGWGRAETQTLLGGAAYIFGCRKFSASLVNGQNDSSRHIICLDDFFYSSYLSNSRNRSSPTLHTQKHSVAQRLVVNAAPWLL